MHGRERVRDREEGNQGTHGVDVSNSGCNPYWRVSIFITCVDRVRISVVGGTEEIVYFWRFFGGDEEVDWEAVFEVLGGDAFGIRETGWVKVF